MGHKDCYFDNAATTKPDLKVMADIVFSMTYDWYNPSANYQSAKNVKTKIEEAREKIANYINCSPEEIYFTSGATEANNWAINHFVNTNESITDVLMNLLDHPSIDKQRKILKEKKEVWVNTFPMTNYNRSQIDLNKLHDYLVKIKDKKYFGNILASCSLINNEVGTIYPIKKINEILKTIVPKSYFHVDATQALTHIPIDVKDLGIDMLSASFHKFGGVKGIGFLYIKKGTPLTSMILGGHQENDMRAGTENIHYIVAMGNHIERLAKTEEERWKKVEYLSNYLREHLYATYDVHHHAIYKNGDVESCSPYINSFTINGISAKDLITLLDLDGIKLSAGSACSSGENKPSRVLTVMGLSDNEAKNTIRISINENNTEEEINYFCERLIQHIKLLENFNR